MSRPAGRLAAVNAVAFLATTDQARARGFFEETLGLALESASDLALVFDLEGVKLRVTSVERLAPQPFTVLGWEVSDISAAVEALAAAGVSFERFQLVEQDPAGVWTAPSGARVAWFKDPDGNILSVTQHLEDRDSG